ncbi:MAG TPA: hypothetical protein VF077_09610 [Nitrospiraceae bacterium]
MASKNRNKGSVVETDGQDMDTGIEADDDTGEQNPLEVEADDDDAEDIFQFDASLLPEGVKVVDLAPDFVRPEGFLMVPRIHKKTGEIAPMSTTFAGILHDVVPWVDNRGKERVWFACEATADIPTSFLTGQDENKKDFVKPITKGIRVGISGSGAINALKAKKGHFILLHWTGRKVTVKNGEMWQIHAKVSEKPVIEQPKA